MNTSRRFLLPFSARLNYSVASRTFPRCSRRLMPSMGRNTWFCGMIIGNLWSKSRLRREHSIPKAEWTTLPPRIASTSKSSFRTAAEVWLCAPVHRLRHGDPRILAHRMSSSRKGMSARRLSRTMSAFQLPWKARPKVSLSSVPSSFWPPTFITLLCTGT